MKFILKMKKHKYSLIQLCNITIYYKKHLIKEGFIMLKFLAKVAEKYAKSTNTACFLFGWWHQPKMPASLIKKD